MYDQTPVYNQKKTLLPRLQNSQSLPTDIEQLTETSLFDIYLCDNCEAELYSLEAYRVSLNLKNDSTLRTRRST